jgi:hypothetical protein
MADPFTRGSAGRRWGCPAESRNTVGHNLVWATTDLTPQNYDLLVKNIAASCLHAISKLYPYAISTSVLDANQLNFFCRYN